MTSIGIVAYYMNHSTEQTNKVSFKAARIKYREQYRVEEIMSPPVVSTNKKQRQNTSSFALIQNAKYPNSTNKPNLVAETTKTDETLTNSSLTKPVVKQSIAVKKTLISSDLQVLSSFDCIRSIPAVLLDYTSNMFLNEYGQSHKDFHSLHRINETLPLLKRFNINCDVDQNCSTSFQYDKSYGVSTTGDETYIKQDLFYCCPSVHNETDQAISDVCKRAQKIVGKSIFRESKNSTFLERVIELITIPYT